MNPGTSMLSHSGQEGQRPGYMRVMEYTIQLSSDYPRGQLVHGWVRGPWRQQWTTNPGREKVRLLLTLPPLLSFLFSEAGPLASS